MEKDRSQFNIDDLNQDYRELGELIGIETLILLCKHYGGGYQYIPQYRNLFKFSKYQQIIDEFDGENIKALLRKYDVSYSTVYRLVKDEIKKKRYAPLESQISFFQNECQ